MFQTSTLTVDLGAIVANWKTLRAKFTGDECAAVVKADAYGMGMIETAVALEKAGCNTFFVATLEEAITLRATLPDVRILVFHGVAQGEEFAFASHRIIPVLNSGEQINRWKPVAAEHIHAVSALHVDTAMGRLGLQPEDFFELMDKDPTVLETCKVGLIMSHLACAHDPAHALNASQLAAFQKIIARAPGIPISLANSGGIYLPRKFHFNLARPGCSLYGIAPYSLPPRGRAGVGPEQATTSPHNGPLLTSPLQGEGLNPMKQVATWEAPILMTRTLAREQTLGYGATVTAKKGTRIATVMTGYAEGYPRHLSNVGSAYVGDHRVKLLGRVTMDMLSFDVTNVPESLTQEGMRITLLGDKDGIRVEDVAAAAGTIGYEILTRLGGRIERKYARLDDRAQTG